MLVSGICVPKSWITGTEGRRSMWRLLIHWATTSLKWSSRIMPCTVVYWRRGKSMSQLNVSSHPMHCYILQMQCYILLFLTCNSHSAPKTLQATGSWVKQQVVGARRCWMEQQTPHNHDTGRRSCDLQLIHSKFFARFLPRRNRTLKHLPYKFSIG